MCGIKCLNVGQFGRLQSYMGSRTSKWTLNTVHTEVMQVMASFGEFLPMPPEKICTQEDDQFMGSFLSGFPFIFWNFFIEVKLKSNSFNSCTIYIIPQLCNVPVFQMKGDTVQWPRGCHVPHTPSQTNAPTLFLDLFRAGEGSCAGAFRRSSVCVRSCERGNTGDAGFQQLGAHS